ncbi:MAG: RloB family protein [Geovibrio sp.]|nr:RloB family protein [Geovibrio sp.]
MTSQMRLKKAQVRLENYIKKKKIENESFQIILSSPCFEFWKLIHFDCYRKCFVNYDECEKELTKQIKQKYEKTETHLDKYQFYKTHKAQQSQAVSNSKAIRETIKRDLCDYSFTEIDILIEALHGLCDKK